MGCLTAAQVTAIKAEIAKIDLLLTAIETAYSSALTNSEIDEYRFDAGDGSQRVKRRNPAQLREEMEFLESKKSRLQRKLDGTSNVNMNVRRR